MKRIVLFQALMLVLAIGGAHAQSVDTSFTYQGFVNDGVTPANGEYDFEFSLWDGPSTDTQQEVQYLENVQVSNGLFNVTLNMGRVFAGQALWMQIGMRPGASADPYTILTPRQPITAAPYAQGLVPGTYVFRESDGPVFSVENGFPTFAVLVEKVGIDAFTSDGKAIRAYAGEGTALEARRYGSTGTPTILAESDATAAGANVIRAELTAETPGFLAAAIYGQTNGSAIGIWGTDTETGIGVVGATTGSGTGVLGTSGGSGSGTGVWGTSSSAAGLGGLFQNSANDDGAIGLRASGGTNNAPDIVLAGTSNADEEGILSSDPRYVGSDLWLRSNDAVVVQLDYDAGGEDADFEIRNMSNEVIFNVDESGATYWYAAGNSLRARMLTSENGNDGAQLDLYNDTGQPTITLDAEFNDGGIGRVTTQELQITGGADLSEYFDISASDSGAKPEPGMVVCIDSNQMGKLTVSAQPYDRTVAGIISGAGGVRSGFMMGQKGKPEADGAHAVALTGRVYVWADAASGPIVPGDLLTTSATPGHAMKVTDYARAQGAIIGKAMSPLSEGRGLVLVLVTLH